MDEQVDMDAIIKKLKRQDKVIKLLINFEKKLDEVIEIRHKTLLIEKEIELRMKLKSNNQQSKSSVLESKTAAPEILPAAAAAAAAAAGKSKRKPKKSSTLNSDNIIASTTVNHGYMTRSKARALQRQL